MTARELILFQEHHITSRASAAKRLRDLADKVEAMTFMLGDHQVALPEQVKFKVEYDQENQAGTTPARQSTSLNSRYAGNPGKRCPRPVLPRADNRLR